MAMENGPCIDDLLIRKDMFNSYDRLCSGYVSSPEGCCCFLFRRFSNPSIDVGLLQVKCRKGKNQQITRNAAEAMLASTRDTATDGDVLESFRYFPDVLNGGHFVPSSVSSILKTYLEMLVS